MRTFFLGVLLVSCIGIIISTLLMEPKAEGMGSISGSSANVFGHSASKGKERILSRLTIIFSVLFVISTIVVTALSK